MHNDSASRRMHAGNGAFARHFLSSRSIRIGRGIIIYLVSVSSLCGLVKSAFNSQHLSNRSQVHLRAVSRTDF